MFHIIYGFSIDMPTIPDLQPAAGRTILDIVWKMIKFMGITITTASVLALMAGSVLYLQSYGKDPMIEKAKTVIKWSIWGMVMGLLSYGIVQIITTYITGLSTGTAG